VKCFQTSPDHNTVINVLGQKQVLDSFKSNSFIGSILAKTTIIWRNFHFLMVCFSAAPANEMSTGRDQCGMKGKRPMQNEGKAEGNRKRSQASGRKENM
jgi:hypothetical protein